MKKIYGAILLIIASILFFECQKEISINSGGTAIGEQTSPITATLQGNIFDENNDPVAGVTINVGTAVTTTNSKGYFKILQAALDKNASVVTATLPGYFKAYRTFSATSGTNQITIKLIKKILAGTINASQGGSITLANGSIVALPANGVINASGSEYTQSINVYASYIDPTLHDIGATVPGSFIADDKNNKRVVLSSYGMLAINLETADGEKLQIASQKTATLTFPIPASKISSAPASISLWYLDEQSGIWKEQGTATKNGNNYVGQVQHFSYWNCDANLPGISFSAVFKTSDNQPLINTNIVMQVLNDSGGCAHGFTDSLGQVAGLIPANTTLLLEVYDQCGYIVYSKNIGPFSGNTDLGTIVIDNTSQYITTFKGQLASCNNTPVTNGYANIDINNFVYYANVDAGGNFKLNIVSCSSVSGNFTIYGVDKAAQQQGAVTTSNITGKTTDVGTLAACGTSTLQFMNYTLDGKDYSISGINNDSLTAVNTYDSINMTALPITYITGNAIAGSNFLDFAFHKDDATGVYQMQTIDVTGFVYGTNTVVTPFTIAVTKIAAQPGDYFEGNFSGSFNDANGALHIIKCSFRVLRIY
jgi:hypothetical protein